MRTITRPERAPIQRRLEVKVIPLATICCLIAVSGCNKESEAPAPARSTLDSIAASGMILVPRKLPAGYFMSFASVDDGGGTNAKTGEAARTARRFSVDFTKNSSDNTDGGQMVICVGRPGDFEEMCGSNRSLNDHFSTGKYKQYMYALSATNYPGFPVPLSELTADYKNLPWVITQDDQLNK